MKEWLSAQLAAREAFEREHETQEPGFVDASQTEQLRELGYIE